MRARLRTGLILLILITCLFAAPDRHLDQKNVHIYYAEKDARIAGIALNIVSEQQTRLHELYHLAVNPIHIYIADQAETYRRYAGAGSPVWSAGLASDDRMLVKSPTFSRQSLADFKQTLLHETVHVATDHIPLPVWFSEGFAQYEAGEFSLQKRILVSQAVWRHDLMSLRELSYLMQMDRDKAEAGYAQSVAMVDFLIDYFGQELTAKCLHYSQEFHDFDKGFVNAFLMSPVRFEQLFREKSGPSYRLYILLDQSNLIWFLVIFLLILGFILTKFRRKRLLRKWERDEENEPDAEN